MRTRGTSSKRIHVLRILLLPLKHPADQHGTVNSERNIACIPGITRSTHQSVHCPGFGPRFVALVFFELVVLLNRADDIPFWSGLLPIPHWVVPAGSLHSPAHCPPVRPWARQPRAMDISPLIGCSRVASPALDMPPPHPGPSEPPLSPWPHTLPP
ncbi:hypothetical protein PAPYR_13394 [Paratrimastix pyriformis]|uniref:Uncharacterized protein n=1 Tax=Paratrimastix pyriformis TaxID=342808 RepID=A0ABQ8U0A4_9EUKA|nr:hypothetical protein PAPYR_13394 [Paratrimastix pyriformis]